MKGARTNPANRPATCGACWVFPENVDKTDCDKGGGPRTRGSKGCAWGLKRTVKQPDPQGGLW